jgi:hypothetical protein
MESCSPGRTRWENLAGGLILGKKIDFGFGRKSTISGPNGVGRVELENIDAQAPSNKAVSQAL